MPFPSTLSSSWANIDSMWSQSYYDINTNISMQDCFSVIGAGASIPNANNPPKLSGDYPLSGSLFGMNYNLGENNRGYHRRMISASVLGDWCNTIYVTYGASYNITAYNSGNTKITKNGSLLSTLTSRGASTTATLALGDQIHGDQPFTIHQASFPGLQGSYAGYAGYCFASRRDRATIVFYLQNLSFQNNANVQILFTATGNSNITSMASVHTTTLSPGGVGNTGNNSSYSTSTSGNYYILSDQPICVWRGQAQSNDCMPLYPLSSEIVYGWYSTGGHTFAVNNAQVTRKNSGGGGNVNGRSSANGIQTGLCVLGTGNNNTYSNTGPSSTLSGGSYFSGNCTAVFEANALGTQSGSILLGVESQADGNGSEMTPFTGRNAHGRFTMTGGGSAWNAFVSAGYSGSAPSQNGNWGDVIMRFNKSNVFQDAQGFTGQNTTAPHSSKAYFGDGSGTGVSATAADYFLCNVAVQGYQDTDSTDKDESVMIMTNDFALPSSTLHQLYAVNIDAATSSSEGWEDASTACETMGDGGADVDEVYSPSSTLAIGSVLFWDTTFKKPVNGASNYYGTGVGRSFSQFKVDYNGIILTAVTSC